MARLMFLALAVAVPAVLAAPNAAPTGALQSRFRSRVRVGRWEFKGWGEAHFCAIKYARGTADPDAERGFKVRVQVKQSGFYSSWWTTASAVGDVILDSGDAMVSKKDLAQALKVKKQLSDSPAQEYKVRACKVLLNPKGTGECPDENWVESDAFTIPADLSTCGSTREEQRKETQQGLQNSALTAAFHGAPARPTKTQSDVIRERLNALNDERARQGRFTKVLFPSSTEALFTNLSTLKMPNGNPALAHEIKYLQGLKWPWNEPEATDVRTAWESAKKVGLKAKWKDLRSYAYKAFVRYTHDEKLTAAQLGAYDVDGQRHKIHRIMALQDIAGGALMGMESGYKALYTILHERYGLSADAATFLKLTYDW